MLRLFDSTFNIYIHIDLKSSIDPCALKKLQHLDSVQWIGSKYKVNYGGRNHLLAYLWLCELALKNDENQLFHLITGQDFPCKPMSYFGDLLSRHKEINYMEWFELPASHWREGGLIRFMYYYFCDWLDKKKHGKWIYRIIQLQKLIGFKRSFPNSFQNLYGGSTYWSLNRESVSYVLSYTNEFPAFLNRLKHTFCSEEIYFQTVIMNSPLSQTIENNNARFIDWENKVGASPAFLTMDSFHSIVNSDALFARKLNAESLSLKDRLIKQYNL